MRTIFSKLNNWMSSLYKVEIRFFHGSAGRSIFTFALFCFSMNLFANCIKGNCVNGKGVFVDDTGDRYTGNFLNFKLHGEGVRIAADGAKYKGEFVNGHSHGKGKLTYANGEYYIGEFHKGKFQGRGKFGFLNGDSYIGSWSDGKMNGKGTYYTKNGSEESRSYAHGVRVKLPRSDTRPSESLTSNDRRSKTNNRSNRVNFASIKKDCTGKQCSNEMGIYHYADGAKYIGYFMHGMPEGYGKCEFANGDIYEGEWKNNAPNGRGVITFTSGAKYAAMWKSGVPQMQLLEDEEYTFDDKPEKTFDEEVDVYALVVGVASYEHMRSLKYTDDDAYQLYAFLKSPEGGAIPNENVKVLVDDQATKENILSSMDMLFSKADENDVVLLYMSGHGLEGSFVPSDFDGYSNLLTYNSINNILNESDAKHKLCIMDACYSGSLVGSKGKDFAPSLDQYYSILENLETGGTAMLLSSSASEVSLEYSGLRQGVFTHFLMRGLSGMADEDKDKIVTVNELFRFVHSGVKDYTQSRQTPIISGNYNGNMPVAMIR